MSERISVDQRISNLSEQLGHALFAKQFKITALESCTGGGFAAALTQTPGSSQWFEYGLVTYANIAKVKLLSVDPYLLDTQGAVSEPVVKQMLVGGIKLSHADLGVSISGIAGPDGGSPEKPVGTVWFAIGNIKTINTYCEHFSGDRVSIQRHAIECALEKAIQFVFDVSKK